MTPQASSERCLNAVGSCKFNNWKKKLAFLDVLTIHEPILVISQHSPTDIGISVVTFLYILWKVSSFIYNIKPSS